MVGVRQTIRLVCNRRRFPHDGLARFRHIKIPVIWNSKPCTCAGCVEHVRTSPCWDIQLLHPVDVLHWVHSNYTIYIRHKKPKKTKRKTYAIIHLRTRCPKTFVHHSSIGKSVDVSAARNKQSSVRSWDFPVKYWHWHCFDLAPRTPRCHLL